ncbi:MAG: hypothetical protein ACRDMJ_07045 [Solirubrobacteraceae bacterium]
MGSESILVYESRVRSRQIVLAVVAGVLMMAATLIQLTGVHANVTEETLSLLTYDKRAPLDLVSAVVNAVAIVAAAWTLLFLWRGARARNPGRVKGFIRWVILVGATLDAVVGVAYAAVLTVKAHQFATTGLQTYDEAQRLAGGGGLLTMQLLGFLGAFLMAVAFVLVSMQAMNQGMLTRFMGYLGMLAGALTLFQITQIPVVQTYWLLALAYLVSGRWPSGVPLAWSSGRAEPWPSSAEMRNRRAAAMGAGGGRRRGGGRGRGSVSVPAVEPEAAGGSRTRASTPKRKRKRRS